MADAPRARRLAKRISQIVASTLEHEVKDPRLAMVTITDTRLTPDLREATVFYTVYGGEPERTGSAAALASAKGVVRSAVGRQTGVRFTPTVEFVPDAVPEGAARLDELLEGARQADAEVEALAVGATYAGEADPYRKPREDDLEDVPVGDEHDDLDAAGDLPAGPGARSTG
ncbi:MAG: rbfA [Actinomycetospora sp.]|jgi:ribosome-binding factor A|nr:rbfA [Actinomycetospora sp.]